MLNKNGKFIFSQGLSQNITTAITLESLYPETSKGITLSNVKGYSGIIVGYGDTEVQTTDYCLENKISNLTYIDRACANSSSLNDDYIFSVSTTYKNNTGNPITITELGLICSDSNSHLEDYLIEETNPDYCAMIVREVIDPVIISPNETKTFTMVIGN